MSNTTVNIIEAAEDARLSDLRMQEEIERQTRIERTLTDEARVKIRQQEDRFRAIEAKLDAASSRLPDLDFHGGFAWPNPPDAKADSTLLQSYLNHVRQQVDEFDRGVTRAIEDAQRLMRRREATAAAWRALQVAQAHLHLNQRAIAGLCQRMGQLQKYEAVIPPYPPKSAELEVVQNHVSILQSIISEQEGQLLSLRAQTQVLDRAGRTSGGAVTGVRSADEALRQHDAQSAKQALAQFNAHLETSMRSYGISEKELPSGVQRMIAGARQMAIDKKQDWSITINDWFARESTRRNDVERSSAMLKSPPEGIHQDAEVSKRWHKLVPRLQAVMAGHEHFNSDLEMEFDQIRRDAQRHLNYLLTRAQLFAQLAKQGMEVVERDDGKGLVVIDLTNQDIWLDVTERKGKGGEFAAGFEIKKDTAHSGLNDAAQTASVCDRLNRASGGTQGKVNSKSTVLERKSHITRAKKPKLKSRSMSI